MGKGFPDSGTPVSDPPRGWPRKPVFNPPGGPPGPPIQWGDELTNETVEPGFGYIGTGAIPENDQYFYHPDHLGSTAYVTNLTGAVCQFFVYLPYGEALVDKHTSPWKVPYTFSAKEQDAETKLTYFEARYYDSKYITFLSVDPMWAKYPHISPYVYCNNNPIGYIDPTGSSTTNFLDENGELIDHIEDGSNAVFKITGEKQDKIYKFHGWDDTQNGERTINVTSVIQAQQSYNMSNPSLEELSNGTTFCNRNTLNVINATKFALEASGTLPTSDMSLPITNANTMVDNLAKSLAYVAVNKEKAKEYAAKGELVVMAWKNPTSGRPGHMATLSVGENIQKGEIANIGPKKYSGFVNINQAYSKDKQKDIIYYILNKNNTTQEKPKATNYFPINFFIRIPYRY